MGAPYNSYLQLRCRHQEQANDDNIAPATNKNNDCIDVVKKHKRKKKKLQKKKNRMEKREKEL